MPYRTYGTTVKSPTHQFGRPAYIECCHCKRLYTHLGIARHWAKCPANPKKDSNKTNNQI